MRYTSEYIKFLERLVITENSIVIGKDDKFYLDLGFSEKDIELIRKQENDGDIDFVSYILNLNKEIANRYLHRVKAIGLGVLPDEIEHLIELSVKAGEFGLPVYLILEQGFELASDMATYDCLLLGLNPIKYKREGYDIKTITVMMKLLKEGIDIRNLVTKDTVLDSERIKIILDYFEKGKDLTNIIKYNLDSKQIRLMEALENANMKYDIKDCLQDWDIYRLGAILDSINCGNNILPYIDNNTSVDLIEHINYALDNKCNVDLVIKYNLSYDCMEIIRDLEEEGVDVKQFLEEGFTGGQAVELGLGIKDGLDISSYKNLRYCVITMRNLRLIALEDKRDLVAGELSRDVNKYDDIVIECSDFETSHIFTTLYGNSGESDTHMAFEKDFKIKLN